MMRLIIASVALAFVAVMWIVVRGANGPAPLQPTSMPASGITETATFACGCFWGSQAMFERIPGVINTRVGYCGGKTENPTYKDVCTDLTGHAEAVEIVFDPQKFTYQKLLEIFFDDHDPTTVNRQGPDSGTQYRSVIFYHSPQQKAAAEAEKKRRDDSGQYVGPIVTQIVPAGTFYPAEDYHQFYFDKQGVNWTCHVGNGKKTQ